MNRICLYALALAMTTIVFGQSRETRSLDSFTAISVGEAIDMIIVKGSKESVELEVDGVDLSDVETEVSGNRLKVGMRNKRGGYRNSDVKVIVTYVAIDEINVSSAADLKTDGPVVADELEIDISSAADARIEMKVMELDVDVASSGDLEVRGTADRQRVDVASAGDYDAFDLVSNEAIVDVASAGDANVNVTGRLNADAASGGSIRYKGNPDKVYADSNSGGSVKKY